MRFGALVAVPTKALGRAVRAAGKAIGTMLQLGLRPGLRLRQRCGRAPGPATLMIRPSQSSSNSAGSPGTVGGAQELPPDVEEVIKSIHMAQTKAVLYATGGAVQAMSWLLSVPGASNTVLEASVPYSKDSLVSVLGKEPEQYCSAATAAQMAVAAYKRAALLCAFGSSFVGVGATCSLATVPLKRGDHRAYIAVHGSRGTRCAAITLSKGARSRLQEDAFVSRLVVKMLAEESGCANSSTLELPSPPADAGVGGAAGQPAPDALHLELQPAPDPLEELLAGRISCVEYSGAGEAVADAPRGHKVYLPGSFNPLHEGHKQLLASAVQAAGAGYEGAFELTVQNADKGLLPADEVRRRVQQFTAQGLPVVITRAPLFTDKANLFPHSKFVLGYDTVVRMVLPKYYRDSYIQMVLDFARCRHQGCSFIVAGRKDSATGRFMSLADVDMPPELADLYPVALPESAFRLDVSSTEIRRRLAAAADQQQAAAPAAAAPAAAPAAAGSRK